MSDAYSIMSPSFTRPRHIRRSSLSTVGGNAVQLDAPNTVASSSPPRKSTTQSTASPARTSISPRQTESNRQRDALQSPPSQRAQAVPRYTVPSYGQLDLGAMTALLKGEYQVLTGEPRHLMKFTSVILKMLSSESLPPWANDHGPLDLDVDTDYESSLQDHFDQLIPRGPASGTLVRKQIRSRRPDLPDRSVPPKRVSRQEA